MKMLISVAISAADYDNNIVFQCCVTFSILKIVAEAAVVRTGFAVFLLVIGFGSNPCSIIVW